MDDLQHQWRLTWVAELARHLASALTRHLPPGRELVASAHDVAIVVRAEGGPLRIVSTYELPAPTSDAVLDASAASAVLADLQAEVALHLGRAWPTVGAVALTPHAEVDGDAIALAFVGAEPSESIALPPFVPPPAPAEARAAG